MHKSYDRLVPGRAAKVSLVLDLAMLSYIVMSACGMRWECTTLAPLAAGGWCLAVALLRLYSPYTPRALVDTLSLQFLAVAGVTALVTVAHRVMLPAEPMDPVALGGWALLATGLNRLIYIGLESRWGQAKMRVIIVGTGGKGQQLAEQLTQRGIARLAGFVRFRRDPRVAPSSAPLLGDVADIQDILNREVADEVYIAGRASVHASEMQQAVQACERVGVPFALPLDAFRLQRACLVAPCQSEDGFLHYQECAPRPAQYALKRALDIILAFTALVVLSPLLIAVAIAIKVTSRGPVLYTQTRIGLHGTPFQFFKFRSMVVNADKLRDQLAALNERSGPVFKIKHDPRVTRIGRFIRKYSIDELPQLVNVLRGDMAIVGPRPPLPEEVARYTPTQRRRLSVRPGLTCFWQVSGRDAVGFDEWMRMDLDYIDRWSLGVDLLLILKTVPAVLTGRGAS